MTLVLSQYLRPMVHAQIREAKALGFSNTRIYHYYSKALTTLEKDFNCKWRRHSEFWFSSTIMSIVMFLVDINDPEVIYEDEELKPAIVVKALAMAIKEL